MKQWFLLKLPIKCPHTHSHSHTLSCSNKHNRQSKLFALETTHKCDGAQEHCLQLLIWHYFRKITISLITSAAKISFWACARCAIRSIYTYICQIYAKFLFVFVLQIHRHMLFSVDFGWANFLLGPFVEFKNVHNVSKPFFSKRIMAIFELFLSVHELAHGFSDHFEQSSLYIEQKDAKSAASRQGHHNVCCTKSNLFSDIHHLTLQPLNAQCLQKATTNFTASKLLLQSSKLYRM